MTRVTSKVLFYSLEYSSHALKHSQMLPEMQLLGLEPRHLGALVWGRMKEGTWHFMKLLQNSGGCGYQRTLRN